MSLDRGLVLVCFLAVRQLQILALRKAVILQRLNYVQKKCVKLIKCEKPKPIPLSIK